MYRRAALATILTAFAAPAKAARRDRWFLTSDGVRLHYIEAGPARAHTIVFVPGWTMPAWIWERQIAHFSRRFRVIAFDPRGQGDSQIAAHGYDQNRRGQDIAELLAAIGGGPALLVGWSLGVLDALAYVHAHGDARLAGLVLIDNSVGEEPPPAPSRVPYHARPKLPRPVMMRNFVRSMFVHHQPAAWLDRLTQAALRTPEPAADALLAYPVPRSYWKGAIYAAHKPILYVVRPKFAGQAANLAAHHADARSVVLRGVGHALFVDDASGFNALLDGFIKARLWR